MTDLNAFAAKVLVAAYNDAVAVYQTEQQPVKKFKDKATAVARIEALCAECGLRAYPNDEGTELVLATPDEAGQAEETATLQFHEDAQYAEESAHMTDEDAAREFDFTEFEWALDVSADDTVADVDGEEVEIEAPAPKPAKKEKAPKKPRTEYQDDLRIEVRTEKNPKRAGSAAHARFALYRDGMTVGEFLDACVALEGDKARPRYRYIADLAWDEERAYITVWTEQLFYDMVGEQGEEGDASLEPYLPVGKTLDDYR